jgi:hypothetical protein
MRIIYLLFSTAALAACSNERSTTITSADGKDIKVTADSDNDSNSGKISFESEDGEGGTITFGDAAAKQGLPLGLPVYPGGTVQGAFMGNDGKNSQGGMATVLTSDAPDKVIAFYKSQAEGKGFAIKSQTTSTSDNKTTANFAAEGKGGETLVVTVTPSDDGKTAAVIMGGQKK